MKTQTMPSQPAGLAHLHEAGAYSNGPKQESGDPTACDDNRNAAVECRAVCVIEAIAQAIGGQVIRRSEAEPGASPALYLPRADLLLVGTGLIRPSVLDEAKDLANLTGDSVAVVRIAQEGQADRPFTVDILMSHSEHWTSATFRGRSMLRLNSGLSQAEGRGAPFASCPPAF